MLYDWKSVSRLSCLQSVQSELHCVQRHGSTVLEEVNCTEAVSMATWSRTAGLVKTQTVSTLLLLRAQPGTPPGAGEEPGLQCIICYTVITVDSFMFVFLISPTGSLVPGVQTDLQFEEEGAARPGKAKLSTPQRASQTVRMLCGLTSDPQLVGLQCNRFHSTFNCLYL